MPDHRRHRGPHPSDPTLFAPATHGVLRRAAEEYAWLLSRGYPENAALKLVGDRHTLRERQRRAVWRGACAEATRVRRHATEYPAAALAGEHVAVDAFNLIITAESALGGAYLFVGHDGCVRDLAGLHGSYRLVDETPGALAILTRALAERGPGRVTWYLDAPVSNSGRLRGRLEAEAEAAGLAGDVRLVPDADGPLAEHGGPVLTADGPLLDRVGAWHNLLAPLLATTFAEARVVDLRGG